MKKLTILTIMILMTMVLSSQEKYPEKINNYIATFQMQKINYQGVDGYFIPFSGYKQMLFVLNDFVFLQEKYDLQKAYIDKYEKNIFRKNTALGVSISFNVGIAVMAVGLGFLCYNLALINK